MGTLRLEDEQEKANARSEDFHIPYKGRLRIVLAQAGPQFDPAIKNDKLRHFISVGASDGYRALWALLMLTLTPDLLHLCQPTSASAPARPLGQDRESLPR